MRKSKRPGQDCLPDASGVQLRVRIWTVTYILSNSPIHLFRFSGPMPEHLRGAVLTTLHQMGLLKTLSLPLARKMHVAPAPDAGQSRDEMGFTQHSSASLSSSLGRQGKP